MIRHNQEQVDMPTTEIVVMFDRVKKRNRPVSTHKIITTALSCAECQEIHGTIRNP